MTYQNPIAKVGDYADPFVLKYNGKYYLYCTNPDIRCWSSADLLHWKAEGPSIEEGTFPELVPFAPEVVYWNGYFYMYTSPSGHGHYVLRSEKPTGPFRKISGNVGHAIDGSVFIDDDGKWYFYWAGDEGIWGCEMKSPVSFGEPVLTGAALCGWTEGPFVCKKDGMYYMTYTGNHYLSKGYRILAARSRNPLTGYEDDVYNPIVIKTEGEVTGLGHSSTVTGPDLVSHYIVYHNMRDDLLRDLNIDRQLWEQNVTQVLGPTREPQNAPSMPDYVFPADNGAVNALEFEYICGKTEKDKDVFFSSPDGVFALSRQSFSSCFTAEFHLKIMDGKKAGIVLAENAEKYYSFVFEPKSKTVQVYRCSEEKEDEIARAQISGEYDFEALHCIRVSHDESGKTKFYVDNRLLLAVELGKGSYRVGYRWEKSRAGWGYTAVTEATEKEECEQAVIPAQCGFYPVFGEKNIQKESDGSILLGMKQYADYRISAKGGEYNLYITCKKAEKEAQLIILADGKEIGHCCGETGMEGFSVFLSKGVHELRLYCTQGAILVKRIRFSGKDEAVYYEEKPEAIQMNGFGKKLWGDSSWSDYTVEAQVCIEKKELAGNAGVLLRVTEPAEGGEEQTGSLVLTFLSDILCRLPEKSWSLCGIAIIM